MFVYTVSFLFDITDESITLSLQCYPSQPTKCKQQSVENYQHVHIKEE